MQHQTFYSRNIHRYSFLPTFFFLLLSKSGASAATISLDDVKPTMVKIYTSETSSFYKHSRAFLEASGVIVDKNLGLVLTNKHVAGGAGIFTYEVKLHNGKKIKAEQVYYDKNYDIALLRVDPSEITDLKQLEVAKQDPRVSEKVFLISNNECIELSCQDGVVSDNSEVIFGLSYQVVVTSLNTRGGSSGAPLLNKNLEIVGLHFASSDTYSLDVHRKYIADLVEDFRKQRPHNRKTLGVCLLGINVSDASKYIKLPKRHCEQYIRKFPKSMGRVLAVFNAIEGFPSHGILQESDIIWEVNGKILGPEVKDLDSAVDNIPDGGPINITVYRDGNFLKLNITPESLDKHTIREVVDFAGAHFFEADETIHLRTGLQSGKVLFRLHQASGSPLSNPISQKLKGGTDNVYSFELLSINGKDISSLTDLKSTLPLIESNKKFYITYRVIAPLQVDNSHKNRALNYDFSNPIFIADVDISKFESTAKIKTVNNSGIWSTK